MPTSRIAFNRDGKTHSAAFGNSGWMKIRWLRLVGNRRGAVWIFLARVRTGSGSDRIKQSMIPNNFTGDRESL
jgi:hypothetical protein